MSSLSQIFLLPLFSITLLLSVSVSAQESTNAPLSSDASATNVMASPLPLTETPGVSVEAAPTSTEVKTDGSTNVTPMPLPEPSSPVAPTDPSMIPPPETAAPDAAVLPETPSPNDPNVLTPSSSEAEAAPTPPIASTESIEKKRQQLKVRYYEVRTQVEKDSAVVELKKEVTNAPSEERKRQALRVYYEVLFGKMKNIAPEIKARCDTMQAAYLRRLEQTTLEPTIPLALPPAVEGSFSEVKATPSPIPFKVHKKNKNKGNYNGQ